MHGSVTGLDGENEVGGNAHRTIAAVKESWNNSSPASRPGWKVEILATYDRSLLKERALTNLVHKLLKEFFSRHLVMWSLSGICAASMSLHWVY